jgi:hypothetical protein
LSQFVSPFNSQFAMVSKLSLEPTARAGKAKLVRRPKQVLLLQLGKALAKNPGEIA